MYSSRDAYDLDAYDLDRGCGSVGWIRSSAPSYSDILASVNFSLLLSLLTRSLSFGCVASRCVIGVDGDSDD